VKQEQDCIVKTLVRQEKNMEIFVTDAPEVDFDKLNEEQSRDLREKFEMVDQQS
jgi:homoserine trans-succinylase